MDLDVDACYRVFRTRDPRFDGRLFGGVRTTRIDRRRICPAPMPKRENMTFTGRSSGAGSWLPPVPALSAGNRTRVSCLARDVEHRIEGVGADRPRRTR